MTMDVKIDYLSWTVLHDLAPDENGVIDTMAMYYELAAAAPRAADFVESGTWREASARGHYRQAVIAEDFTKLSWGGQANHVLIELPGTACQRARDSELLPGMLAEAEARATRLDVACDVPGGCSPREFVDAGYSDRFEAYAELVSASGVTEYVGSMKSERYARVYRYNAPHPRAGTLRIEHVLRRGFAKGAIATLLETGQLIRLVCQLGNSFGWKSDNWIPDCASEGKLTAKRSDRHEPGRVRWLHQVVMPALVKADREGLIDLSDFAQRALQLRAQA